MCKNTNFLILVLLFTSFISQLRAQSPNEFFKAVGSSNLVLIESYLYDEVDLCIKDDQQLNNKGKAFARLKTFLASHIVEKVEPMHNGASKGKSSEYKVAKLTTKNGIYRLFVYSENTRGKTLVKEVRIEKFND